MKKSPLLSWLSLGLVVVTAVVVSGCGGGDGADEESSGAGAGAGAYGAPAAAVAATGLIESPTAEQLAAARAYPLDTCIVAGEKLGSMGDPIVMVYGQQQIKFCCKGCIDDFKDNPAGLMAKLSGTN
ncbi:MAG: hypothetical protein KF833_01025 [Verrucomicrobiae bacterium]|nr:hypothetical protein [Verrucomicrobiae bacterium]